MANTYTQLYIHLIFAVKYRNRLISRSFKEELQKYITGIIQNKGNKLLAINTMPDHAHIFLGYNPAMAISAFSYSHSQIDRVVKYIRNQEKHHKKNTFREEYLKILNTFDVEYKEEYLFKFFDDVN